MLLRMFLCVTLSVSQDKCALLFVLQVYRCWCNLSNALARSTVSAFLCIVANKNIHPHCIDMPQRVTELSIAKTFDFFLFAHVLSCVLVFMFYYTMFRLVSSLVSMLPSDTYARFRSIFSFNRISFQIAKIEREPAYIHHLIVCESAICCHSLTTRCMETMIILFAL